MTPEELTEQQRNDLQLAALYCLGDFDWNISGQPKWLQIWQDKEWERDKEAEDWE